MPVLAFLVFLGSPQAAPAQDAEVVIEWNRILQVTVATPGAIPPTVFSTRPYSMVQIAVFDALNSIDYLYTPYAARVNAAPNASRSAAAAQAAHDVLVALAPSQRAALDAALATSLSTIAEDAAREGSRTGAAAAQAILDLRAADGWDRLPPQYILPDMPGYWQPTPPANSAATLTHYPDVQGLVIASARQFLVGPPPALTSEHYAADFNEVKSLGAVNSTTRTPEQTQIAQLWAGVGTTTNSTHVWNNLVRDLARSRGLTGLQTARLYALLNMTSHDAFLVSFTGKFLYGLWRQVTAIRAADRDGNPATVADPAWTPLLNTPPYPSYPGNMACYGAAMARVMARHFGRDDIPFSVTWAVTGGTPITRQYSGFRQLGDEEARSRIYGGIHFTFDSSASIGVCSPLADYVYDNTLRAK
jgi:hypothetical protein